MIALSFQTTRLTIPNRVLPVKSLSYDCEIRDITEGAWKRSDKQGGYLLCDYTSPLISLLMVVRGALIRFSPTAIGKGETTINTYDREQAPCLVISLFIGIFLCMPQGRGREKQ